MDKNTSNFPPEKILNFIKILFCLLLNQNPIYLALLIQFVSNVKNSFL